MDDFINLSIGPGGFGVEHLPDDPQAITIQKASGEVIELEPRQAKVNITEEHPEVGRMDGDWGAICEVFRKSNYYYAAVTGCQLAAGDTVILRYKNAPGTVTLKVIEIENGRVRIDSPLVKPSGDRQSP
jgi:hypothetical protein